MRRLVLAPPGTSSERAGLLLHGIVPPGVATAGEDGSVEVQSPEKTGLAGVRVLVVEDEFLVALELEHVLDRQGCEVIGPVPSIERALSLVAEDRPDAAVLDVNVSGGRITPVAEALRARDVPFVLATGYGPSKFSEPALREAPRVNKPVVETELLRVLREVVSAH